MHDLKLDFGDVLLRPKRSDLSSRSEVNLIRDITFKHSKASWSGVPIITANMDTVGTFEMYNSLSKFKMITCFHKYYAVDEYPLDMDPDYYMISSGIGDSDFSKTQELIAKIDPKFLCIDVANGYSHSFVDTVRKYREANPSLVIAGGNVCTREMVEVLTLDSGLDIVKIGIGSGSVCTTRLQTGVGYPQLSAVLECSDAAHGVGSVVISDGGVTCPGDFSKAFCAGADFAMSGGMFSGHDECPGDIESVDGKMTKAYYGMSSSVAMNKHSGGVAHYRSSEGKFVHVPYKGPVEDTVRSILGGIRSTCTYIGAKQISHMPKCATFMRVNRQVNNIYS